MNEFDYAVLVILLISTLLSIWRGLVKEVLSLIAWVIAFWVAQHYAASLLGYVPQTLTNPLLRLLVAFVALFLGTLLAMGLLNLLIGWALRTTGLSVADRGLGGVFGLLRGLLIVLVLVVMAGFTPLPQQAFWKQAMFSPMAEAAARVIKPHLPPEFSQYIKY